MSEDSHAHVFIYTPSGDSWMAEFGISLSLLLCSTPNLKLPPDAWFNELTIGVQNSRGSMLSSLRQQGIAAAAQAGATHILMLDSDMQFPRYALIALLLHNVDVVGCNAVTKTVPPLPVAQYENGRRVQFGDQGDRRGLLRVGHLGTAVMLVRLSCLNELSLPLFYQEWDEEEMDFCGEDVYFCRKLREAKIDIWCDQILSREIRHVGAYRYSGVHEPLAQTQSEIII